MVVEAQGDEIGERIAGEGNPNELGTERFQAHDFAVALTQFMADALDAPHLSGVFHWTAN